MIAVASKVDTCTYTVNELSRSHANIQADDPARTKKNERHKKTTTYITDYHQNFMCSRVKPLKPYNLSIARS